MSVLGAINFLCSLSLEREREREGGSEGGREGGREREREEWALVPRSNWKLDLVDERYSLKGQA